MDVRLNVFTFFAIMSECIWGYLRIAMHAPIIKEEVESVNQEQKGHKTIMNRARLPYRFGKQQSNKFVRRWMTCEQISAAQGRSLGPLDHQIYSSSIRSDDWDGIPWMEYFPYFCN